MVYPSALGIRMKIKCIVCGFEKEVDKGIYQKDMEAFHLRQVIKVGHPNFLKMKTLSVD